MKIFFEFQGSIRAIEQWEFAHFLPYQIMSRCQYSCKPLSLIVVAWKLLPEMKNIYRSAIYQQIISKYLIFQKERKEE